MGFISDLVGSGFWDVCYSVYKRQGTLLRLFAQVIDGHLCTELMCSVCNSICSLLKVIDINDNTLGSSILTHTFTICPVPVQI